MIASVAICLLSTLGASGEKNLAIVLPDNPRIHYTGRWDFSNPLEPWSAWQGSTITINFIGTGCDMAMDPGSSTEWYRVVLDGEHLNSKKISVNRGLQQVALASGLPAGIHRLDLIKETYVGTNSSFFGFRIHGTGLTAPPALPPHRIEFYGDSNLAGYSLESERNKSGSGLVGVHFGFSGVTARMLDAEYHNISASGETLGGMINRYDRMQWWSANPKWDFSRFRAEVVVINLGANDVGSSISYIKSRYHLLLDKLRAVHPTAHIVLANGFGWDYDEPADYTSAVVAERNDSNMSVLLFPWVFEKWHGCESDQAGMSVYLAAHISKVMGWTMNSPDVLNGFGLGGDVANGSFEGTAPFGGFAWRYFDDAGVSRELDQSSAKYGNAWLRLTNGASVHQPNPLRRVGEDVEVRMWVRGQGSGTVTIDFRDQQMYTAPMYSNTTPVQLGPQWQLLTIRVSIPAGLPRMPFHTRLTIRADSSSQMDVDGIKMKCQA